jgi:hypothetical protein
LHSYKKNTQPNLTARPPPPPITLPIPLQPSQQGRQQTCYHPTHSPRGSPAGPGNTAPGWAHGSVCWETRGGTTEVVFPTQKTTTGPPQLKDPGSGMGGAVRGRAHPPPRAPPAPIQSTAPHFLRPTTAGAARDGTHPHKQGLLATRSTARLLHIGHTWGVGGVGGGRLHVYHCAQSLALVQEVERLVDLG